MKLLIFIGISVGVYWLIIKPFFLRAPKEKPPIQSAMEKLFDAYNQGQANKNQARQPNAAPADGSHNREDDGEYIEYEEVK